MTSATAAAVPGNRAGLRLLIPIFFFSGFASLLYQVVWQKALSQAIGVDHISVTLIVALFMLGLGLGGILGIPVVQSRLNPIHVYVVLETVLGLFGLVSLRVIRAANRLVDQDGGYATDFLVNLAVLLLPTVLMGLSLPLILHLFRRQFSVGKAIAVIYSINIFGAAAGALAAGFVLIGTIGLTRTSQLAALINFLLGITVAVRVTHEPDSSPADELSPTAASRGSLAGATLFLMSFLSGFAALSYEIVFFRLITAYFGSTAYAFTILIVTYLLMMAAGNYVFGRESDSRPPLILYLWAASGAIVTTLIVLWGQEALHLVGFRQNYLVMWPFRTWLAFAQIPLVFALSLVLMVPVAFTSGFFPVVLKNATRDPSELGSRAGLVYFTQTMGNFSGALLTGFALLPMLGTVGTLRLLAVMLVVLAMIPALPNVAELWRFRFAPGLTIAAVLAVLAYPADFYSTVRLYYEADKSDIRQPTKIRESAFATTLGYEKPNHQMEVYVGRMFSNSFPTRRVQSATISDCFPMDWIAAIDGLDVRRALYIGVGSGVGTHCVQSIFPGVELDIVEINPDLVEMIQDDGSEVIRSALAKSHVVVSDGRRFVQQNPARKYDLIQVGVFSAWCSGCGNVFTEEFFRVLSTRLTAHGGVTFNAYPAAVQAALRVFPGTVLLSPGVSRISDMWATNQPGVRQDAAKFKALVDRLNRNTEPGAVRVERRLTEEGCLIDGPALAELVHAVTPATDDRPTTEYFLTNNQFTFPVDFTRTRPVRDMRTFGCEGRPPLPIKGAAGVSPE